MGKYVIPQKKIICLLALAIKERVVIIPFETLYHISRMACPLVDLSVSLHGVDKMRSTVLDSDCVSMVMVPKNVSSGQDIVQSMFSYISVNRFTASVS